MAVIGNIIPSLLRTQTGVLDVLHFEDDEKIYFGSDDDYYIYSDGTDFFLRSTSGYFSVNIGAAESIIKTPATKFKLGLDDTQNIFLICQNSDTGVSFGHSAQTNPTLFVHSADATDTTQYISIAHDQTNARFDTGKGYFSFGGSTASNAVGANGIVTDYLEVNTGVWFDCAVVTNNNMNVAWQTNTGAIRFGYYDVNTASATPNLGIYAVIGVSYTTTGAATVTLASGYKGAGRFVIIVDTGGNAATNNITINTEGTETISGAASWTINTNYGYAIVVADGSNWYVVSSK